MNIKSTPLPAGTYERALAVVRRSEVLRETAEWQANEVEKFCKGTPDTEFELLPYDEQEKVVKKTEELLGRLNSSLHDLKALDEEYEAVRKIVNEHYKRNVMPPCSGKGIKDPEENI